MELLENFIVKKGFESNAKILVGGFVFLRQDEPLSQKKSKCKGILIKQILHCRVLRDIK